MLEIPKESLTFKNFSEIESFIDDWASKTAGLLKKSVGFAPAASASRYHKIYEDCLADLIRETPSAADNPLLHAICDEIDHIFLAKTGADFKKRFLTCRSMIWAFEGAVGKEEDNKIKNDPEFKNFISGLIDKILKK